MNKQLSQQLSLFGLRPTQHMNQRPAGQLMIDVLELSECPKEDLMKHD